MRSKLIYLKMFELVFLLFLVVIFQNTFSLNAETKEVVTDFTNVISEISSIGYEDLNVDGYQFIQSDIDFNNPGIYTLKYLNLNSKEFQYRKLTLFNPNDYLTDDKLKVDSINKLNQEYSVIDLEVDKEYTYVIYKTNQLCCYKNGYLKWSEDFSEYCNVSISDIDTSINGVLVYLTCEYSEGMDVVLIEYDNSGLKLRERKFKGSLDEYASSILFKEGLIYLSGISYSKDGDFEGFYPVKDSNQAFISCINYSDFKLRELYGIGNRGNNELLQTIFNDNEIILKVKFNENGPFPFNYTLSENCALFSFDYSYGLSPCGYETYETYGLDGDEEIVAMEDNYGLIIQNEGVISLYYTGNNQTLTGRVTSIYTSNVNYDFIDYRVINYYGYFELILEYQKDKEKLYKVYRVDDDSFYEVFSSNSEYFKNEKNFYCITNTTIDEMINFKTSELKKVNTTNGYILKRTYTLNSEDITPTKISESSTQYGLHDMLYQYKSENANFFFQFGEFINCECNVESGVTYDLNLQIEFNGKGVLNNKEIESGTIINEEGRHILVVEAISGEKEEFIFEIKSLSQSLPISKTPNENIIEETYQSINSQIDVKLSDNELSVIEETSTENYIYLIVGFLIVGVILGLILNKICISKKSYMFLFFLIGLLLMQSFEINASENPQIEVVTKEINIELIDESHDYLLVNGQEDCNLYYKDNIINEISFKNAKMEYLNNKLFLFYYYEEYLYLQIYQEENLIYDEQVIDNKVLEEFSIDTDGKYIYLASNLAEITSSQIIRKYVNKNYLDKICGVIFVIDELGTVINLEIYGGKTDDYFLDLKLCDEGIVIVGKRQKQGGGDFGNFGTNDYVTFMALINFQLSIINYKVINQEYEKCNIFFLNEKIVFFLDNYSYIYSKDLNKLSIYSFDTSYLLTDNLYSIYAFTNEGFKILSTQTNIINTYIYPCFSGINELKVLSDKVYLKADKMYYFNILNLERVEFVNTYNPNTEITYDSNTITSEVTPIVEAQQYFDPMISGVYQYDVIYDLGLLGKVSLTSKVLIPEEVNIVEGRVYPVGYHILFKGIARLNGELINNNYSIKNPGTYTLVIEDNMKNQKTINFEVATEQIEFTDLLIKNNNYFALGTNVFYYYSINLPDRIEIDKVILDNEDYYKYTYKRNNTIELQLAFNNYAPGTYNHKVNGFYYYDGEDYLYYPINEDISFTIFGDDLYGEFVTLCKEDALSGEITLRYSFNDYYNLSRNLMIKAFNNSIEETKIIPLGNQTLKLDFSENNISKYEIYYIYDINCTNKYLKLCDIDLSNYSNHEIFGDIIVNESQTGVIDLEIIIDSDLSEDIQKITVNDTIKYSVNEINTKEIVIVALISFAIGFVGTLVILKLKN